MERLPWLKVKGNRIVDTEGIDVVLKGVNIADPEHIVRERPRVDIKEVIYGAADLGSKVVRIPVGPENFYGSKPEFGFFHNKDDYFSEFLQPAVDYCIERGMYAIVDLHYVDTNVKVGVHPPYGYLDKKDNALEFWEFVAPRFKSCPNVLFDIYNEPVKPHGTDKWEPPYDWKTWKDQLAQPIVNVIRKHAPDNLIIVGGPDYCLAMSGAADNPVTDPIHDPPRIVYATHSYPNHPLEKRIAKVLDPIVKKVPVFVSEWGFEQGTVRPVHGTADKFGAEVMDYMLQHQLGWTAWVYDNLWESRMVDAKWFLMGDDKDDPESFENNGRMGGFVKRHL